MAGRWIVIYGGLLAAVGGVWWLHAEPGRLLKSEAGGERTSTSVEEYNVRQAASSLIHRAGGSRPPGLDRPEPGRFYAVDVSSSHPSIDLAFDGDSHYELIVSSLGDAAQTSHVGLTAEPCAQVESLAAVSVTPIGSTGRRAAPPRAARWSSLPVSSRVDSERRFFLHVTSDALEDVRGYVPVTGVLAGEGRRVRVYLDRDAPSAEPAPDLIAEIIRLLDDEIIPRSRAVLGEHADIDGDGKLAVLLTGWLGKLCGGKTALNGFVRSNDFQTDIDAPFGNHADVIYLNTALQPGPALKTLLAHEYTHAVCFSRRLAAAEGAAPLPVEEDWLNEAIAHVAENLHQSGWSNLDQRVARFLAAPQTAPLVVRDYYRAGLWRDDGCRGATYLFLRFCTDQFGDGILRDLVEAHAVGTRNLEQTLGMSFSELFRHWTIALADDGIASVPVHGTLGECSLSGPAHVLWPVDQRPCRIDLRGTTTTFVTLTNAGRRPVMHVTFEVEPQARMQLTLRRVMDGRSPNELPRWTRMCQFSELHLPVRRNSDDFGSEQRVAKGSYAAGLADYVSAKK